MQNSQTATPNNDEWQSYRLGEICEIKTGKKDVNAEKVNGIYPFFTCAQEVHKIDTYTFDEEAVLVAGNGFFNVKYYKGKFDAYQRTYVLHDFKEIADPKFVYHFVTSRLNEITKNNRGSTIQYIRLGDLADQEIALPNITEQKRLVEKIEVLLDEASISVRDIGISQKKIRQFRQSVLSTAITGKLTEDWREKNKTVADWEEMDLRDVSVFITDGDHNPPKRVQSGVPYLTAKNVKNGSLLLTNCSYVTKEDAERLYKRYKPIKDDVVITCVGTLGETAIVKDEIFVADRNLAIIRPNQRIIKSDFLFYLLNSPSVQNTLITGSGSSAQPHLYLTDIRSFSIRVPSLDEQNEIVSIISRLFAYSDSCEKQLVKTHSKADKLTQSILAKAFRGEL